MTARPFVWAIALAVASAAVSAQVPVTPATPNVAFSVNTTVAGVTTSTTYQLDRPALEAIAWQFGQYWRAAELTQAGAQATGANCLTAPEQASPGGRTWDNTPPIPNNNFDWTAARIVDPRDQALLSVAPSTGAVYRNALRLGNATVQKLCLFGDIYGKGKTSGAWSRWDPLFRNADGTLGKWTAVPLDRDASVLE